MMSSIKFSQATSGLLFTMALIAGFIRETGFIALLDERLKPKMRAHNISHGEAIALLMLSMTNGRYTAIYDLIDNFTNVPVDLLLEREHLQAKFAQKDVILSALQAVSEYGSQKLFQEFACHAHKFFVVGSTVAIHMDSTSISLYHRLDDKDVDEDVISIPFEQLDTIQQEELKQIALQACKDGKSIKIKVGVNQDSPEQTSSSKNNDIARVLLGNSKDMRMDLGQFVIISVTDSNGIPLYFEVADGNANDKTLFAETAKEILPILSKEFSDLKYVIADSAACTQNFFNAVLANGKHVITRMPDNMKLAKEQLLFTSTSNMQPVYPEQKDGLLFKPVSAEPYEGVKVTGYLYYNPSLRATKTPTYWHKANKELKTLENELKKTFSCKADAESHFKRLKNKAKFVTILAETDPKTGEYLFDATEVMTRRGRKSKTPEKNKTRLKDISVKYSIELDIDNIKTHIDRECMYVLVTTDIKSKPSPAELSGLYKNNCQVEQLWQKLKNSRFAHKAVHITDRARMEAFLTIVGFYLLATTCLQVKLRTLATTGAIRIPKQSVASGKVRFHKVVTIANTLKFLNRVKIPSKQELRESLKIQTEYKCLEELFLCMGGTWRSIWKSCKQ